MSQKDVKQDFQKVASQRMRRLTKNDLLSLLDKTDLDILKELQMTPSYFMMYLEQRRYTKNDEYQILEIVIEILSRACTVRMPSVRAHFNRMIRMLKDCQEFLFEDIPRVLHSCVAKQHHNINIVQFIFNYMNVLETLLHIDFFPCEKILNEIFPTLENFMNRLQEQKVAHLDKASKCFKSLRIAVEKYDNPRDLDDDITELENFRLLSVLPKSSDIVNFEISNVPQNIIDTRYRSVDHFLNVHYRLTREDLLRSFRECVNAYISFTTGCLTQKNSNYKNNIFEDVTVTYPPKYKPQGIFYNIVVKTSKEVDWSKKEVLMPGTLVFLTPDMCKSVVFATISRHPKVNTGNSKICKLEIKLEDDLFEDMLFKDTRYAMIQPEAYFECYKHVLSGIKQFSESNFPLSDIIVEFDYSDVKPEYLHGKEYYLHETCNKSVDSCSCKKFNPLNDDDWPTPRDLELDEHQYNAFKIALTRKVAVIQGPPGTGKTYIGLKVVETLLKNLEKEHKPIVICCLTNHALDQFLEGLLKFTEKIVRLGFQSKSEQLEPHKLDNMICAVKLLRKDSDNPKDEEVMKSKKDFSEAGKKSLKLLEKIAPELLKQNIKEKIDEESVYLSNLSNLINDKLNLEFLCENKFLDETALNDIIDNKYKSQLRHASGVVQKSLCAGMLEWLGCSRLSDLYDKCHNKFIEISRSRKDHLYDTENIWKLTLGQRFELFYYWRKKRLNEIKIDLKSNKEDYKNLMKKYESKNVNHDELKILMGADIIGLTTTGACKYKNLIKLSKPYILVIEEAAQVLESHIIASLVPSIQHLILIGDHEQLRPLPADHELSEKYHLNVSMFERLFRNEAPSATLVMQHRMKPCIAELLVPRPYKEYESYENVYKYEEIKGVESSVFFFDHHMLEDENSSGSSSSNNYEALMVVSLAKYFNFIYYEEKMTITILATYAAQVILIQNYLIDINLEIKVTTVDNFQGEESDIILLSFVRSNSTSIGFLRESNRVCVALSRAKKGMFCFGNFKLFADKNDLWKDIVEKLQAKNMIGEILSLKCPNHNTSHSVKSAHDIQDFLKGCSENCDFVLPCEHRCTRKCHFYDSDHSRYLCRQPCEKIVDDRVCPHLCFEKCKKAKRNRIELPCGHHSSKIKSKCMKEVQKILPCNHHATIACYIDVEQYKCNSLIKINLECGHKKSVKCYERQKKGEIFCNDLRQEMSPCGHMVEVHCTSDLGENDLLPYCNKACGVLLDCGHPCIGICRFCFDTGIHMFCVENCELILQCGHKCAGKCGSPCPPCKEKCFISCEHNRHCINACLRDCVSCPEPCERKCLHKKCTKLCGEECDIDPCTKRCLNKLPCGHQCIGLCGEPCPFLCRICNAEDLKIEGSSNCLYVELECEHIIEVHKLDEHIQSCLDSFEWPCCPECSSSITKGVHFKSKIKEAKQECIQSNDTKDENSKVRYLLDCIFGTKIIPAQFISIHKKILQILKVEGLESHSLLILKNCIMLLKKLLSIASLIDEYRCDEHIQKRFDTLMLWIYRHLTEASFQQLKELEIAVKNLENGIVSRYPLKLNRNYFPEN